MRALKAAVLFPGQGSQEIGMADPWIIHPASRSVLEQASEVLGDDVVEISRDGSRLASTETVQPALFACGLAAYRALEAEGFEAHMAAGHSLGEYAALVAAGALDFEPALRAVVERARATQEAARAAPGAMTAIVGCSPEDAAEICRVAGRGDVLGVANENSPQQTVLSGSLEAIERAEDLARSRRARVVRLKVSGAFHSPLMRPALERVRKSVGSLEFREARIPVIPNADGEPTTHPSVLRHLLSRHLLSPVRWHRSMLAMDKAGVSLFVEAGPGDVLAKLARRCVPEARTASVGSPDEARELMGAAVG